MDFKAKPLRNSLRERETENKKRKKKEIEKNHRVGLSFDIQRNFQSPPLYWAYTHLSCQLFECCERMRSA